MSEITPIVMFGAAGRMGRMILGLAAAAPDRFRIAGAVEFGGHPLLGSSMSQLVAGGAPGGELEQLVLSDQPPPQPPAGTVAIHFALPAALDAHLDWTRQRQVATVIGTTGMEPRHDEAIQAAAKEAAMLPTPNVSLGVNVLFWLAERAAGMLDADYDIEIVEMHHHHKKDAPSGTARRLAEVVLEARGGSYDEDVQHGREGIVGERPRGEVGMHALRGSDVAGDHTVIFAGPNERIELTHRAHSREVFAQGALRCARWLSGKAPGIYTMKDVLGL